jgi:hypothetical protein
MAKFDSRINSWRDLVRESGLHLIGAPIRCTYPCYNQLGATRSELLSTQSEPISTQPVIPYKVEHSTTSLEEEGLSNQDQGSLAKHSGVVDEVWYHGYQVSWTQKRGIVGLP